MICPKCAAAAEIQRSTPHFGNTVIAFDTNGPNTQISCRSKDVLLKVGRLMHTECPGGTHCDCQHKDVGDTIDWQKVEEARRFNATFRTEFSQNGNDEKTASEVGSNPSDGREEVGD